MNSTFLTAWSISFAGAAFAGWYDYVKTRTRFHDKFGKTPYKTFDSATIEAQCVVHGIEKPEIQNSFVQHAIRPLLFFIIFRAFTQTHPNQMLLHGLIVMYYVGFFLFDDMVGKKNANPKYYVFVQLIHWFIPLVLLIFSSSAPLAPIESQPLQKNDSAKTDSTSF